MLAALQLVYNQLIYKIQFETLQLKNKNIEEEWLKL